MCKVSGFKITIFVLLIIVTILWVINEDIFQLSGSGNLETLQEIEPNRINYFLQKYVKGIKSPLIDPSNRTGK